MLFQRIILVHVIYKIVLFLVISAYPVKCLYDQMIGSDLQRNIIRKAQCVVQLGCDTPQLHIHLLFKCRSAGMHDIAGKYCGYHGKYNHCHQYVLC